ncbi:Nucleotidyltransferase substrate binding protein like protein [compost metagenome]
MVLDFSPLANAITQLEKSQAYYHSGLAARDQELARQFRAAAIQAFECTYELAWKMLKRYLEHSLPNPAEVDEMPFPNLIRTGNEQGLLLSAWPVWRDFRKARGMTSHTYDEQKAEEVFAVIPAFLDDVRFLLQRLRERQNLA